MKRAWIASAVFVAVSALLEFAFRESAHPYFWWHSLPAFDFFYGFLGCGAIVLGSKWIGHTFLQQGEDFYDRDDDAP